MVRDLKIIVLLLLSQEQYVFIHDAVLESIVCGNTQIPADDFRSTFEALKQTKPDTDESGFQAQFNVCHLYS